MYCLCVLRFSSPLWTRRVYRKEDRWVELSVGETGERWRGGPGEGREGYSGTGGGSTTLDRPGPLSFSPSFPFPRRVSS